MGQTKQITHMTQADKSIAISKYMLRHHCTIRQCAEHLPISKSNIHKLIHSTIKETLPTEYTQLIDLLSYNRKERRRPRQYWKEYKI